METQIHNVRSVTFTLAFVGGTWVLELKVYSRSIPSSFITNNTMTLFFDDKEDAKRVLDIFKLSKIAKRSTINKLRA